MLGALLLSKHEVCLFLWRTRVIILTQEKDQSGLIKTHDSDSGWPGVKCSPLPRLPEPCSCLRPRLYCHLRLPEPRSCLRPPPSSSAWLHVGSACAVCTARDAWCSLQGRIQTGSLATGTFKRIPGNEFSQSPEKHGF